MHMQNADLFEKLGSTGKETTAECTTNQKKSEISTVPHNFEAALW